MMLDYKKLLESLLRELIDKKIISEWYCNGAGYFWKYNEKEMRIIKLEADNRLLEQRGSDILKELLDKNKRCIELEKENAELTKDRDYYSDALDKQIEATLKLDKEYAELKEQVANLEGIKLAKTAKVTL